MSQPNVSGRFKLMGAHGEAFRITIPDKAPVAVSQDLFNQLRAAIFNTPTPAPAPVEAKVEEPQQPQENNAAPWENQPVPA